MTASVTATGVGWTVAALAAVVAVLAVDTAVGLVMIVATVTAVATVPPHAHERTSYLIAAFGLTLGLQMVLDQSQWHL